MTISEVFGWLESLRFDKKDLETEPLSYSSLLVVLMCAGEFLANEVKSISSNYF